MKTHLNSLDPGFFIRICTELHTLVNICPLDINIHLIFAAKSGKWLQDAITGNVKESEMFCTFCRNSHRGQFGFKCLAQGYST